MRIERDSLKVGSAWAIVMLAAGVGALHAGSGPGAARGVGCGADADCADGDACTVDRCDTGSSTCSNTDVVVPPGSCCDPATTPGSDADLNGGGTIAAANDGNSCTDDGCSLGGDRGVPVHTPVADGTPCNDGNFCTVSDACAAGNCTGAPRNCDDGQFCTGIETCDLVLDDCVHSGNPCPPNEPICREDLDVCSDCPSETPGLAQFDSNPFAPIVLVDLLLNRTLAIRAGTAGQVHAIRVHFKSLPPPWNTWNGRKLWVTAPTPVCETSGVGKGGSCPAGTPTFPSAGLTCDPLQAAIIDWTAVPGGIVYVAHPGIVPRGAVPAEYEIQVISGNCSLHLDLDYSPPKQVLQPRWGDVCGTFDFSTSPGYWVVPDGNTTIGQDVVALLDEFANRPGSPSKARADLEPCVLDFRINIADCTRALDGFRNLPFPFSPGGGFGCTSTDPCAYAP